MPQGNSVDHIKATSLTVKGSTSSLVPSLPFALAHREMQVCSAGSSLVSRTVADSSMAEVPVDFSDN